MKYKFNSIRNGYICRCFFLGSFLPFMLPLLVQANNLYILSWNTIDGGGGISTGEQYKLFGTIGQADAGSMSNENIELLGGFWLGRPLCLVTLEDFSIFAQYWLDSGTSLPADFNSDGTVDIDDLYYFIDFWLWYCPDGWQLK